MRSRAAPAKRTAATIAAEIGQLDTVASERTKALAALEADRPALIEAGDVDAVEALDSKIRRARIEAEIAGFRRGKLAEEHAAVLAAEDHAREQAERRAIHAAALKAAEEGHRLYREEYPRLARELVALLTRTAEIGKQIQAANERLPDGAAPVPTDFEPSRGRAEIPARTASVRRHVWVHKKDGKTSILAPSERREDWRKEIRVEDVPVDAVRAIAHVPLQDVVSLPGLAFADAPFWSPRLNYSLSPATEAMLSEMDSASFPPVVQVPLLKTQKSGR